MERAEQNESARAGAKGSEPMTELRIGLVQMRCEKGAVAENLAATEAYLREGAARGVAVMCFPEASVSGYVDPMRYPEAVLTLDHPAVAEFVALTRVTEVTALGGIIEVNHGGLPHITRLVAHGGELVGVYRKRTIPEVEAHLFAPIVTTGVFALPAARFGVAICADIDNASLFAEHAAGGARVIFEAAAPGLYGEQETRDWRSGYEWWRGECEMKLGAYARANHVYVVVATQAGRTRDEDFPGGGFVFAPDGRCLAATEDWREGVLYATLSLPAEE
jgi:predicted amidohydrolase